MNKGKGHTMGQAIDTNMKKNNQIIKNNKNWDYVRPYKKTNTMNLS